MLLRVTSWDGWKNQVKLAVIAMEKFYVIMYSQIPGPVSTFALGLAPRGWYTRAGSP